MDKEFWVTIAKHDYVIPTEYTLNELKEILFGYLGSTDPELRDDIAYIVYANWLKREMFTKAEIRAHVDELLANLDKGIGETESDSIFLRAFSVLLLAEIVHNDNKKPLLEQDQIQSILAKGLWYLEAEKDPRGYLPVKGWAHALAHTADLMLVLARNQQVGQNELSKILDGIADKIKQPNNYVYIHREDERLASAIIQIFQRNLVTYDEVEKWTNGFLQTDKFTYNGIFQEENSRVYQNTRNLLRSIYLQIPGAKEFPNKEKLQVLFLQVLQSLQRF